MLPARDLTFVFHHHRKEITIMIVNAKKEAVAPFCAGNPFLFPLALF
jgi:hypothetical protein